MFESHEPRNRVVDLPGAGVPADRGLASLGLVMQLAGRSTGALAALIASVAVLESRVHRHAGWFFFAVAASIARSQLHRIAGRELVYPRRTQDGALANPFEAMRTYMMFGIGHAAVIGLAGMLEVGATTTTAIGVFVALSLWPAALAVLLHVLHARGLDTEVPLAEDRGLEGASLLMTVLGASGVLSTGAILLAVGALPSRHLQHGWGVMLVVVFTLLLVRSCLHVRAGLSGLREPSFDRPSELTARYASFGVISACGVGGVLALFAMAERLTPEAIVSVAVTSWLLASWPVVIRRYFNHQQFAELLAGDRTIHRRAPDAGLTGLGWLLTGHAVVVAALLTVAATADPQGPGRALGGLLQLTGPVVGRSTGELVLGAGVVGLELAAAAALLRMSEHRRAFATIYALVAGAAALALAWPLVQSFDQHHGGLPMVIRLIPTAAQIVIPAATLVLVHRTLVPAARARYRDATAPGAASAGTPG
jgi:hypothetical protein